MRIEIQRTNWIEFVYNKIKASEEGIYLFKTTKTYIGNNTNTCEWSGSEIVSDIYLDQYHVSSKETTERLLGYISTELALFVDNVAPLFLDSIMSLVYNDEQAKAYVENIQKIKGWYDRRLFGEVENKFPIGAPPQLPQAHQL